MMVDLGCVWSGFIGGAAIGAGIVMAVVAAIGLGRHYVLNTAVDDEWWKASSGK